MPIAMPASPGFRSSGFGLQANTTTFESPFTRDTQRLLLGGQRWTATYTLPRMTRAQADPWKAFFLQLDGRVNTFYGFDPDARNPRGPAGGTPLVNGAGQTGATLVIDGCTPNVTGWMKAGDFFGCNGQLHMLTQDANTNGGGQTTLNFRARMRASPADNAPLTVRDAACTMILVDDMQAMWRTDANAIADEITFSAVEVW